MTGCYINRNIFISVFFFILLCSCSNNKTVVASFDIIRHNYFDTTEFFLNESDTNKFNLVVLEKVYQVIKDNKMPKAILLETVYDHVPLKDYGLYNIETGQYFEMTNNKREMAFKLTTDSIIAKQLTFINNNLSLIRLKVDSPDTTKKHDIGYFIVSVIEVHNKNVIINSYYLQELK